MISLKQPDYVLFSVEPS